MTLQELSAIITDAILATEDDIRHYQDLADRLVNVTIQVMDVLKDINLEMRPRDLKHALLVQKIVGKVREHELRTNKITADHSGI